MKQEAQKLADRTKELFENARMNMTKLTMSQTAESKCSRTKVLGEHPDSECKVLGINCDPSEDRLVFKTYKFVDLAIEVPETKRNILHMSARFFDPLGMLAPFSVRTSVPPMMSARAGGIG